jgi:hypothetical protein
MTEIIEKERRPQRLYTSIRTNRSFSNDGSYERIRFMEKTDRNRRQKIRYGYSSVIIKDLLYINNAKKKRKTIKNGWIMEDKGL